MSRRTRYPPDDNPYDSAATRRLIAGGKTTSGSTPRRRRSHAKEMFDSTVSILFQATQRQGRVRRCPGRSFDHGP